MDVDDVIPGQQQQNGQPRGQIPNGQQPPPPIPPPQNPQRDATEYLIMQCMQMMTQILQRQTNPTPNPESVLDSLAANIKEFRFDADSGVTFRAWYDRYEDLFREDATRLDDPAKVRLLLRKLGMAEHERYVSSILPQKPAQLDFAATILKLQSLFSVQESVVSRRYKCLQVSKGATEDHVAYACRVNRMCVGFDLGVLTQDQFKCLVYVCGLKADTDVEIRTRLLTRIEESADVTLEQLSGEYQRLLNLKHDSAMIEATPAPAKQVNAVKQKPPATTKSKRREPAPTKPAASEKKGKPQTPCWFCGALHYVRDCTYKSHKCTDCSQVGHREGYCESAKKSSKQKKRPVNSNVVVVNECTVQKRRKYVTVGLDGTMIRLQLDTASDITVIGRQLWKQVGSPALSPATVKATTASGNQLQLAGEFIANITIGEQHKTELVRVSERPLQLLGSDFIDSFGLWSAPMDTFCCQVTGSATLIDTLQREYPDVFRQQLGLCNKMQVKLELKPQCKPVFCPKRPVAYAMLEAVDKELDRLEQLKIITPVDFSEWAAPIVVVRKANGTIRICGDYSTGLNAALQPHQYPLPIPEDIYTKLANCLQFSIVDLSDAFLQVLIAKQFRHLLTINTHRGLYWYNRLPPGVKIAPGAFQQLIDTMLAGLKRTFGYMDDVVVGGTSVEDHDRNLRAVLQRIQEFGFTIRAEKCAFRKHQIRYLGHIIDSRGLRPDPDKIEAITRLPPPSDVSGVRSFLGAINYYGKFVPNMRMLRYPLDKLLLADSKFEWTSECQQAFDRFKELLSSDLLLTHYDPKQEIIVSADASSIGIGATISHRFPDGKVKVVQHASRALTKTEMNYSQPDREGLAIIFAVTKFHKMLFGRRFRLQTDHAPLLRIFGSKKGIPVYTANRLQRFALTLLLYDFEMEYVSTDKFGNADVLSRLIDQHAKPDEDYVIASITLEDDIRSVVTNSVDVLPLSFRVVARSTLADPLLRKIYRYVKDGWPKTTTTDPEVKRFQTRQESLCEVDGCLLFAERLIIPAQYRTRCLEKLHRGHPGIQRMKALARSYVYWPSLDDDITRYVKACTHCASVARSPAHAVPVPWPRATNPWQRVHVDFAGPVEGDHYLIVVDAYSKWPEVVQMRTISSAATITVLRGLFARLGSPVILVSDNGTQFTSADFGEFCAISGIQHLTTAPHHPQSNGQAERFVDTFKRAVKKIREGRGAFNEALDTFLQTYRSTPNSSAPEGKSPSELMFGRKIRTCLELLRPPPVQPPAAKPTEAANSRSFSRGDAVYAKVYAGNNWKWAPGIIIEPIGSVMYNVWVDERRMLRTHLNQLRSRVSPNQPVQANNSSQLSLDILLGAWDLPRPTQQQPGPTSTAAGMASTQSSDDQPSQHWPPSVRASSTPRRNLPSDPGSVSSSSSSPEACTSSSSSTLTPFNTGSMSEEHTVVSQPRRSSRTRRAPQWFDPYHLY